MRSGSSSAPGGSAPPRITRSAGRTPGCSSNRSSRLPRWDPGRGCSTSPAGRVRRGGGRRTRCAARRRRRRRRDARAGTARCPGLPFVEGDAQRLAFADGSFDADDELRHPAPVGARDRAPRGPPRACRRRPVRVHPWITEGNVAYAIVDEALAAHAAPVELPDGPDFYRFADAETCRQALVAAGFDPGTFRVETVAPVWRVPIAEHLFEADLYAGVRIGSVLRAQPPERLQAIRDAIVAGGTPTGTSSRCRPQRGSCRRPRTRRRAPASANVHASRVRSRVASPAT